jgi:hypothetical protein
MNFAGELSARDLNDDSQQLAHGTTAHQIDPRRVSLWPVSTVYPSALQE